MVAQSPHSGQSSVSNGKRKRNAVKSKESPDKENLPSRTRASARIQEKTEKQRAEKELLVRRRVDLLEKEEKPEPKVRRRVENAANGAESCEISKSKEMKDEVNTVNDASLPVANGGVSTNLGAANTTEKSSHARVKDTIRLFNKHYLHFVQEEQKRCETVKVVKKSPKKKKSKKEAVPEGSVKLKTKAKRPDLKAISKMMENKEVLYPVKQIGNISGIDVGHQFYSRAEMVAVGFHSHWLNGIDFLGQAYAKGELGHYTFPIAVAIVLSGMYEDDLDNAEDVIYTGQGGHDLTGNKRQIRDQVLERGNLALKNCVDQDVPVRVIRGHESTSSYSGKVYTYDGLYKVIKYWAEKGISGFTVFKFRLRRLEGQPILTTNQVHFVYGKVPESLSELRGLVCEDISGGQENIPIPATNLVDDPPVPPTGCTYIKSMKVVKNVKLPTNAVGCGCKGGKCVDPRTCSCARLNGSDFPYVDCRGGRLIEAKDVVFECGPKCGCGPDCINRTSQRGMRFRLEVFRTPKKGWAVRSWDFIPAGAPVCEYIGVLMKTEDLDNVSPENNYIFDIDCLQTMRGLGGRERRQRDASTPTITNADILEDQKSDVPEYCIDAGSIGNVARYINHSCSPNLFIQCVLSEHHDMKLARVMLFAADNIPPLQELTYDYGYALDSVHDANGKVKKLACYCGATDCRKRLF